MKPIALLAIVALSLSALSSFADAKSASGLIQVGAQIVPGNTVSVYLVNGNVVTEMAVGDRPSSNVSLHGRPLVAVSFESRRSWYVPKRVIFDKRHNLLTVDF